MKKLIVLILLVGLSAFAKENEQEFETYTVPVRDAASASPSLKEKFLKKTGLVEGEYILEKGAADECHSGPLEVVEENGEIAIMYGARAFVVGLGKGDLKETYDGCVLTISSSYDDSVIKETSEEVCKKDGKAVVNTVIKVEKDKLFYTRSLFTDDKPTKTITCSAKLKKKAKPNKKK